LCRLVSFVLFPLSVAVSATLGSDPVLVVVVIALFAVVLVVLVVAVILVTDEAAPGLRLKVAIAPVLIVLP
jgi:hypothetical protein